MSTQKPPAGDNNVGAHMGNYASAEGHSSATERRVEEIQLTRLGARLRELGKTRDLIQAFGGDPDRYASELAKQYADLALKLRETPPRRVQGLPSHLAAHLDKIADIFNWWESVMAPNATVGLAQAPSSSHTGGTGIGADIYPGYIGPAGEVWNSATDEQWWVNTWQYIVPFPATPSTDPSSASLSYRFNVGANLSFYRQDVVSGSVHVYVTVATTGDLSQHPIDFNHFTSSDFAIAATLPTDSVPPMLGGQVNVAGTIPLVPGGTPAIGIIVGLITSVASGIVRITPGYYSNITLAPPGATMPNDLGKIQYRRDQPFWVRAVEAMLEA